MCYLLTTLHWNCTTSNINEIAPANISVFAPFLLNFEIIKKDKILKLRFHVRTDCSDYAPVENNIDFAPANNIDLAPV